MDKAKVELLNDIHAAISNKKQLTGDQLEMFSYFYGAGTGTILAMSSQKTSIDMVLDLIRRVNIEISYSIECVPEFREHPVTKARQVQFNNSVAIKLHDETFTASSLDESMSYVMLLAFIDLLIGQEKAKRAPETD